MEEAPRWVRVMLRKGDEHMFPNAAYQAGFHAGWLIVYRLVGQECEEIAQFDMETVSYYEYVVGE